jgi:hypothetical protein
MVSEVIGLRNQGWRNIRIKVSGLELSRLQGIKFLRFKGFRVSRFYTMKVQRIL